MLNNIYAAIDIGTNTFRLLIAEICKSDESCLLKEIRSERIITRLGEGISHNRLISKGAMQRGLNALESFSRIISKSKVAKISVIATSALREAENNLEFIKKAKEVSGLDITIITGEDEARMTAAGMMLDLDVPDSALLIDIGGGSTELIYREKRACPHAEP